MLHRWLPDRIESSGAMFRWLHVCGLMGIILLFWPYALSSMPGSQASTGSLAVPPPAIPVQAMGPQAPAPQLEASSPCIAAPLMQSTNALTNTIFLPMVYRDHWHSQESALGIQIYGLNSTVVDRIDGAGASWIRVPLNWSQIEPQNTTPENYQWPTAHDAWLADLAARDVRIILTLMDNPSWAATYRGGPIDLVDIQELIEFMEAAVAHYGVPPYDIKLWELYNEPDNASEHQAELGGWGYFGDEPEAYVETLAAVYQPIKAVDPEAQVVLGGLAHDWFVENGGPFPRKFLDEILRNGAGDYFDIMNFHYYPIFREWDAYGSGIIGKATFLRDKLASYGVDKPFICTESGIWSDEEHQGSDELQSRYVAQTFVTGMAADLDIVIWFMLHDEKRLGAPDFGLVDSDMEPKPSYTAYQTAARQLAGAEYVRTMTSTDTGSVEIEAYEFHLDDASVRLVAAWTTDDGERVMQVPGDQLQKVDKYGGSTLHRDGADGVVDGIVTILIGPSPVYLRIPPAETN